MASPNPPKRLSNDPAKDLARLVALLRSSDVKLEVDWEKFMKENDAPTEGAAQMRAYRLAKSLEIDIFGKGSRGGSKATEGPATPKTAGKRKPASMETTMDDDEEEPVEQELQESPLKKKVKSEEKASQITDQDE